MQLRVQTSAAYPDEIQMKAAGYLEGWLSAGTVGHKPWGGITAREMLVSPPCPALLLVQR